MVGLSGGGGEDEKVQSQIKNLLCEYLWVATSPCGGFGHTGNVHLCVRWARDKCVRMHVNIGYGQQDIQTAQGIKHHNENLSN